MQRGLDAETKKQLEEEERRIISDEHWYLDLPELKAKEYELQNQKFCRTPERSGCLCVCVCVCVCVSSGI